MCGRYGIEVEEDAGEIRRIISEINLRYGGTERHAQMKTGEVFPTDAVPVLAASGPEIMKWGFPSVGPGKAIINARSETAFDRPMFKNAAGNRRIAVPTTGFYEWSRENGKPKDKFLFRLQGEKMLYLAGLCAEFGLPREKETRFVILTTSANDSMAPYHDRMPVCLSADELDTWLQDSAAAKSIPHREMPALIALKIPKATETFVQTSFF